MTTQPRSVLDIPLFHKIYDLYKLLHCYRSKIFKAERYTLWQRCEKTALALMETLIETGHRKGEERVQWLHIMSSKLDLLKVFIRLAKDTRTIDQAQYLALQNAIQEIGRMIGGWIKSVPR